MEAGSVPASFTDLTGQRAMGYYDQGFLNYYYYMASQFAVSDRWFSPVASKSIDNRIATFTGGTTQGLVKDPGGDDHLLSSIFRISSRNSTRQRVLEDLLHGHPGLLPRRG
jgi:phospholipase C